MGIKFHGSEFSKMLICFPDMISRNQQKKQKNGKIEGKHTVTNKQD